MNYPEHAPRWGLTGNIKALCVRLKEISREDWEISWKKGTVAVGAQRCGRTADTHNTHKSTHNWNSICQVHVKTQVVGGAMDPDLKTDL